jgi:Protein of unknown function (DUF2587)
MDAEEHVIPEVVVVDHRSGSTERKPPVAAEEEEEHGPIEAVERPAKVMRIGSMIKQLLDEVRAAPLDDRSRIRMKEIYETSVVELAHTLSPELAAELGRMTLPLDDRVPTDAELRVAQAQLVGWLEGLFHGIQATLFAQQMAARNQLDEMRQRGLPPPSEQGEEPVVRPAGYL